MIKQMLYRHSTAAVHAMQDSCAVAAAAAAAAGPALRKMMSDRSTDVGVVWVSLQGRMWEALPGVDQRRLQPMFQQVWRLSPCSRQP